MTPGQRRHSSSSTGSALRILEVVAARGVGVRAQEISAVLRMPQATTYRLLNQLVEEEYLVRTADLRGFGLGVRLEGLIVAASMPGLSPAAEDQLAELRSTVRMSTHLLIYRSGSIRVLSSDPDHPVHSVRDLARYLHASAAGKLFLANLRDWKAVLPATPLHSLTPATVTNLALLQDELELARQRTFAVQIGQLESGRACIAVPVRRKDRSLAAALCVSGPVSRANAVLAQADTARSYAARLEPLLADTRLVTPPVDRSRV